MLRANCFRLQHVTQKQVIGSLFCRNNLRPEQSFQLSRSINCKQEPKGQLVYSDIENDGEYRKSIAPWMKFGEYEKGLLSHLSTYEILRALFVLRLCSFDVVVDKSTQLLDLSKRFGKLAEFVVRKTFYDQFVGGEEVQRMNQVVDSLHRRGLTLMVAPVLEEDVEDEKASMQVYNENLSSLKCLAMMTSSMDKENPILQCKISAIMPAKTLEKINAAIESEWKTPSKLAKLVENASGLNQKTWSFLSGVSNEDKEHFFNGVKRADDFVKCANELGVKVLVDAEFYSCKLAISTISLILMARYNSEKYVVGDTIQGYLKDAHDTVNMELEVIGKLLGSNWYGKIVRGAYMDRERNIAKKAGKPSPICESYAETSLSYDKCVETVLRCFTEVKEKRSHLLIATHNEKSIRLAVQTMKHLGIAPRNEIASFAQIYGMADYLSTPLVKSDYKVYKSTPYGPISKVVPYLARRASENRSVLKGAREERSMLRKELRSRLF